MFEELKKAIKEDNIEKAQEYIKSISITELNTQDATGNLLFHAYRNDKNNKRIAMFKILLQAGIGVHASDSENQSVKDHLTLELNGANSDDSKELEELIHQVEIAGYADLLYAQATNVDLQPSRFPLKVVELVKKPSSSLADMISSLKQQNPDIKILEQEIREKISSDLRKEPEKAVAEKEIVDIVQSRHAAYLSEEGIVPAENDLQKDSYDVRRINKDVSMLIKKFLSDLQVSSKKSVLQIEQEKTLTSEILSALQNRDELNEIVARTIHNKTEKELDNAINDLLHKIPINPEYKTKLFNIKKEINAMTEDKKQELEHEYYPQPISEIIKDIPVIISSLPNVGSSNPDVMKDITDLISVGRANLEGDSKESVVLLGPTGSGKSTLAHAFAGNKLISVKDEEFGGWHIDTNSTNGSGFNQARISHDKQSETKIPNKFTLDNGVQIIDSPGFGDTSKIDEITNSFYINEIFRPNSKLKFVLVVNESQLFSNRGNELIQTINNFTNCFNDIEPVLRSISLVVTQASNSRTLANIQKLLQKIAKENKGVTGNVKHVLEALCDEDDSSDLISIFYKPKKAEITIPTLDSVVDSLDYINVTKELASASISLASEGYAKELFNSVSDQLNQIIALITHVISNPYQHITNNENSVFVQTEKTVSSLLPSNCDVPINSASKKSPNFVEIEILKQLRDNLNSVDLNANTFVDMVPALNGLLEMLMEYCEEAIQPLIANVLYALNQQADYVVFFSKLCKLATPDANTLIAEVGKLKNTTLSLYTEKVKSIELKPDESSDYYQDVIKYLTPYSEDENCKETLYKANMHLGDYYKTQGNDVEKALGFYLDGVELETTDSIVYQAIGDLFFDIAKNIKERGVNDQESVICMKDLYKMALEHYKTCYNVIKANDCFKQLNALTKLEQKLAPGEENSEVFNMLLDQEEYHQSIGFNSDTKLLWSAFSESKTDENRAAVFRKLAEKSGKDDFTSRADNKNFLNPGEVIARSDLREALKSIPAKPVSEEEATQLMVKYQQPGDVHLVGSHNIQDSYFDSCIIIEEEVLA